MFFTKLFLAFCLLLAVTNSSHCSDIIAFEECSREDHCVWKDNSCKCIATPRDFQFIMDASGSVGSSNFRNAKLWMQDLINDAIPINARIGVVRFSTGATTIHSLGDDQYNQGASVGWSGVQDSIMNNMPYTGGWTHTRTALEVAINDCVAHHQPGRDKLILLVTDGVPEPDSTQNPCTSGTVPADLASHGIEVVIVGVGGFDMTTLSCLTNNFISINSYSPSDLTSTIAVLEPKFCGSDPNVVGDPVVRTLDGMIYEFQGLCSYVFLMDSDNDFKCKNLNKFNKFQVIGSNEPCELGSCLRRVIVYLKETSHDRPVRVDFVQNDVLVNGVHMMDRIKKKPYTFGNGKFKLAQTVQNISNLEASVDVSLMSLNSPPLKRRYIQLTTKNGLSVQWNGIDLVSVNLKNNFRGKTCGLLGNKDFNKKNDLRLPDGSILEGLEDNITPLERSWLIQTYVHHWLHRQSHDPLKCKSSTPRKLCDGKISRQLLVNNICKGFLTSLSSLKNCNYYSSFGPDQKADFEEKCKYDMCFCYNDDIFSCASYLYKSLVKNC